ncbi:hypothetical protein [Nonomuraea salmonea]|uniref:hypothetical protein n=1 Tax=Nonomuraea salmonea TaxID=46181 RepID=UPI002FE834E4
MEAAERNAYEIDFPEPLYDVGPAGNAQFTTRRLRLGYTSMVTPASVYDYDLDTHDLILLKQRPVLGGFDPADYEQVREWATAEDGTKIPISLVKRKDTETPRPPPSCTATAATRPRSTPASRCPGCRCSTAGSCSRSPTCGAAARWAGTGTSRAS